jgi:zinc protease
VSEREINDAKSYLTGVFPIRLETQEGMIDQLVQIKMLGLPGDYLQNYRDRVQAVTIDEVQKVASQYVRPDQAAIIVVGDGAKVLDQIEPYCSDIEIYSTSGKRKERPVPGVVVDVTGAWSINIETPMGQSIPATLTIARSDEATTASIASEMGDADFGVVEVSGSAFNARTSLDMDGHSVEIAIDARFEDDRTEGTLTLQNSPPLTFEGGRA